MNIRLDDLEDRLFNALWRPNDDRVRLAVSVRNAVFELSKDAGVPYYHFSTFAIGSGTPMYHDVYTPNDVDRIIAEHDTKTRGSE